jgi:ribosomal protein S18 acetylase RimI-like enzyme
MPARGTMFLVVSYAAPPWRADDAGARKMAGAVPGNPEMETLRFRPARPDDAVLLAPLNAQLIREEGHRNPMSVSQLEERMRQWLQGLYRAVIFESGAELVGYALYRPEVDHVYLRQFYVRPEYRRRGLGREALAWLGRYAWSGTPRLRIDVLVGNAGALAFWRAAGFAEYSVTMEMEPRRER